MIRASLLWKKSQFVQGDICTIVLRFNEQLIYHLSPEQKEHLQHCCSDLEPAIRRSVSESLGAHFTASNTALAADLGEIRTKIVCSGDRLKGYDKFAKVLDSLTLQLSSLANWKCTPLPIAPSGQWYPEPPLISLQKNGIDERISLLELLQQPITLLLLGTLLGSILVPYFNDRSNRRKLRHEERVKIAISIIEQSHETDRRLASLMDYLVLSEKTMIDRPKIQTISKKNNTMRARHLTKCTLPRTAKHGLGTGISNQNPAFRL